MQNEECHWIDDGMISSKDRNEQSMISYSDVMEEQFCPSDAALDGYKVLSMNILRHSHL